MAPTSEERLKVAERLREYSNDVLKDGSLLKTLKDVTGACSWRDVLDRLADLIDPTCEMDDAGGVPASVKDNLSTFFCSECGAPVYNDMSPSYCPYCGARVVERGDA